MASSMDVEVRFAVLDRDQTVSSEGMVAQSLAGSRYFIEQPPLAS